MIPLNHTQVGGLHMSCEYEYFNLKTERMIKIRPGKGFPYAIVTPQVAIDIITDLDPSEDGYEIKSVMMSKGEIEALVEFDGW